MNVYFCLLTGWKSHGSHPRSECQQERESLVRRGLNYTHNTRKPVACVKNAGLDNPWTHFFQGSNSTPSIMGEFGSSSFQNRPVRWRLFIMVCRNAIVIEDVLYQIIEGKEKHATFSNRHQVILNDIHLLYSLN